MRIGPYIFFYLSHTRLYREYITNSEMYSLHLTHPMWTHTRSSGQPCYSARGAVGGSVPCSWYWRRRERWLFTPPPTIPAGPEIRISPEAVGSHLCCGARGAENKLHFKIFKILKQKPAILMIFSCNDIGNDITVFLYYCIFNKCSIDEHKVRLSKTYI